MKLLKTELPPPEEPSFYGLRDLHDADDIHFAWTTQKSEHGGCAAYELHRQVCARLICYPKKHQTPADTERLRKAWPEFKKPWSQLSPEERAYWKAHCVSEHLLPWIKPSEPIRDFAPDMPGDWQLIKLDFDLSDAVLAKWFKATLSALRDGPAPMRRKTGTPIAHKLPWINPSKPIRDFAPDMPGDWRLIKLDFDQSDAELVKRFRATLSALRNGHAPVRVKTGTPQGVLSAIAAQRLSDCRGVEEAEDFVGAHAGKGRFTSKPLRFDEACERYLNIEKTLRIGFTKDGRFRLELNPRAYKTSQQQTT